MSDNGSYYLEFMQVGNAVKVTAIDPASLEEVSIVAPKTATKAEMTRIAVQKLVQKLSKQRETTETRRKLQSGSPTERGILV